MLQVAWKPAHPWQSFHAAFGSMEQGTIMPQYHHHSGQQHLQGGKNMASGAV